MLVSAHLCTSYQKLSLILFWILAATSLLVWTKEIHPLGGKPDKVLSLRLVSDESNTLDRNATENSFGLSQLDQLEDVSGFGMQGTNSSS